MKEIELRYFLCGLERKRLDNREGTQHNCNENEKTVVRDETRVVRYPPSQDCKREKQQVSKRVQ
eukprot:scaffold75738_cov97-Cyclotella_meneghiniana.AAC.1